MTSLSIVFAGTPEFAVPPLEALLRTPHRITAVYTQPDRPAGRGRQLSMSAVKACATSHGLTVEQPLSFKEPTAVDRLRELHPDLMVVVAYGLILPQAVLDIPRLGCLNIHASLLPRWRGAAPIQRAILAGDRETGVGIMRMEAGLDTGPVLLEGRVTIDDRDTSSTLHDRLSQLGATLVVEAINQLQRGDAQYRMQPGDGVVYAHKIRKEEGRVDWTQSAQEIDRSVRAFNPWPIAETTLKGEQLRIWASLPLHENATVQPGKIVRADNDGIDVATGHCLLRLLTVQAAGRKPVSAAEFGRGRTLVGEVLG